MNLSDFESESIHGSTKRPKHFERSPAPTVTNRSPPSNIIKESLLASIKKTLLVNVNSKESLHMSLDSDESLPMNRDSNTNPCLWDKLAKRALPSKLPSSRLWNVTPSIIIEESLLASIKNKEHTRQPDQRYSNPVQQRW